MSMKELFKDGVFAEIDRNRIQELDAKIQIACTSLYNPMLALEDAVKASVANVKEVLNDYTKDEQAYLLMTLGQSVLNVGIRGQVRVRRIRALAVRAGVPADLADGMNDGDEFEG